MSDNWCRVLTAATAAIVLGFLIFSVSGCEQHNGVLQAEQAARTEAVASRERVAVEQIKANERLAIYRLGKEAK